eukprot:scaffold873_cov393-Prasinococcus_capsulatus_cf.AAC.5
MQTAALPVAGAAAKGEPGRHMRRARSAQECARIPASDGIVPRALVWSSRSDLLILPLRSHKSCEPSATTAEGTSSTEPRTGRPALDTPGPPGAAGLREDSVNLPSVCALRGCPGKGVGLDSRRRRASQQKNKAEKTYTRQQSWGAQARRGHLHPPRRPATSATPATEPSSTPPSAADARPRRPWRAAAALSAEGLRQDGLGSDGGS